MKRLQLLFLLLTINAGNLIAQSTQHLKLTYEYLNMGLGEKRILTLLVKNNESLTTFSSKDSIATTDPADKDFDLGGEDDIGRQVYKNATTNQIIFRDFISVDGKFVPCIVTENIKPFTWTFSGETKRIASYVCKSASTNFRGRIYKVWFSEDLPVSHGPWKFYGLPGGMVEIQSNDRIISIVLKKVETSSKGIIAKPLNGREMKMLEYVNIKENEIKEFLKSLAAKLPRGAQIEINSSGDYNLEVDFSDIKE